MGDIREPRSVIVTGAAGYVGRHVVRAVADLGFDVTAVVRPGSTTRLDERARIVEADILDAGADVAAISGDRPYAFIHLAWQDGFVHNSPVHMTALSSHFSLLNAVADAGVARIAALGTMHEVGYWEGAITADTPTAPRSLYGVAKDALRRSAQITLSERVEFAWLRCFYIHGDDRRNNSIFARLLEAADEGKTTFPFTSGRNKYDFIDVEELADQIALAATTAGVTGVINCSSGEPVSLADRVEAFIAENGLEIELEYGAFPDRAYDSPAVWGDAEDIRRLMRSRGDRAADGAPVG